MHGLHREKTYHEMKGAFAKYGKVVWAINTGKGYGFVTFSKLEEAQAVIAQIRDTGVTVTVVPMKVFRVLL